MTRLPTYHLVEKPCQVAWDAPLLNENSTAIAIGTIDQTMYSQVKPSIAHGRRHGLPRGAAAPSDFGSGVGGEVVTDSSTVLAIRPSPSRRGRC